MSNQTKWKAEALGCLAAAQRLCMNRAETEHYVLRALENVKRWDGDGMSVPKSKARRVYDKHVAFHVNNMPE